MVYVNPEAARAYYKAYYQAKKKRKIRPYQSSMYGKAVTSLVTKNSILFLFGEGHEGLGLKINEKRGIYNA